MTTVVLLSVLCVGTVNGQKSHPARADIQALVNGEIGPAFGVVTMLDVDASLRTTGRAGEGALESIEDPYGTLAGAIIFTAYAERLPDEENAGTLGVYREGQIIWAAPPDTFEYCERPANIVAVRELDQNGAVDIVFEWRGCYPIQMLWVYSWDGRSGTKMHPSGELASSSIGVSRGYFDLADVDGDGTIEIIARTHRRVVGEDGETHESQARVFTVENGAYVEAAVQPDPSQPITLPHDGIEGAVGADVHRTEDDRLEFRYTVHNLPSSRQPVDEIHLRRGMLPLPALQHISLLKVEGGAPVGDGLALSLANLRRSTSR